MSQLKKTNLNSVNDLRQTTDDNLGLVFQQLGYNESFTLIDLKLGLGLSTVVIAGLLFLVDKKYTWKDSYNITVIACVLYGIISGILYLINHFNKNVKYIGYDNKGNKLAIATSSNKLDPIYNVTITLNDRSVHAALSFNKFFDVVGFFNRDAFTELVENELNKLNKKSE
ncbi:signal peptidase complex subunit, putative [Candida dubliniensis CD36]|uniref:Signal peptidase complex subunit 2 n=1 Tax=Candida dubliniensis (strain CD36 / ATCC MYA-646 / CBS 7987 / NCPF 3949 / NRRL Y-17841) TaxID=573826 RepID=B9WFD5_CANDC|nr:signal peptidase complex subunit, putative [Candida dubliniensis CD36]CAX41954.1 signal peptidase complex subunit, putative [Candida dubliniensis CD36]